MGRPWVFNFGKKHSITSNSEDGGMEPRTDGDHLILKSIPKYPRTPRMEPWTDGAKSYLFLDGLPPHGQEE